MLSTAEAHVLGPEMYTHAESVQFSVTGDDRLRGRFTDREAAVWAAECSRAKRLPAISVLLVSPVETDYRALRQILAPPAFRLASAGSMAEFEAALEHRCPMVVIADCENAMCCWRDVRSALERRARAPRLIVCAGRDDEKLWAEVVASGADDLLARPFDRDEVVWAVRDAWTKWSRSIQVASGRNRAAGA